MSTIEETAGMLGTTPRYVRLLIEQQKLDAHRRDDNKISISKESIHSFRARRPNPGRPMKTATRDAIANELLGKSIRGLPPRTLARIRKMLNQLTATELAESLHNVSDRNLAELASRARSSADYLDRKRAEKALRDIQRAWATTRPLRGGTASELILAGHETTSSTAASANKALRNFDQDLAFRLIYDHITNLSQRNSSEVLQLMTKPASTGDKTLDALLHAGIAWICSTHDISVPSWHKALRLAAIWNPTGRAMRSDDGVAEFRDANIYLEQRDLVTA